MFNQCYKHEDSESNIEISFFQFPIAVTMSIAPSTLVIPGYPLTKPYANE